MKELSAFGTLTSVVRTARTCCYMRVTSHPITGRVHILVRILPVRSSQITDPPGKLCESWISTHSRFLCVYFDQKILKGSLQPKLKGASVWRFNARSKVPTGWVCHVWSLYRYCKEKKLINVNCSDIWGNLYVPRPGRFLGLTAVTWYIPIPVA